MIRTTVRNLWFDEAEHAYFINRPSLGVRLNRKRIPSVTQIIGADMSHITELGLTRGRYVHEAIGITNAGKIVMPDSLDPVHVDPYVKQYLRFMRELDFRPTHWEHVVYSKTHGYAGTFDVAGTLPFYYPSRAGFGIKKRRDFVLLDTKCNTLPKELGMQLAAYKQAALECRIHIGRCFGLKLTPTAYKLQEYPGHDLQTKHWPAFYKRLEAR